MLDGQQRLQSLFAIFSGAVKANDGKQEQEAYLDLTNGGAPPEEGLAFRLDFSATCLPLPHYRVRDLLGKDAQRNPFDLADHLNQQLDKVREEDPETRSARHRMVHKNVAQLVSLLREEKHFWVEEVDGVVNEYPYSKILDIFVRVNSGGTKLNASDLMFAAMKEGWAEVEQNVEDVASMLQGDRLSFDKSFCLKCLVTANGKGAELSPEKFTAASGSELLEAIRKNWDRAEQTFQELRDFIEHYLKLYADKAIRSYGSFVPLFSYMYHNPRPTEASRVAMRGYYYKSQLFTWYGSQTDNLFNTLHLRVGKPLAGDFYAERDQGLLRQVTLSRGRAQGRSPAQHEAPLHRAEPDLRRKARHEPLRCSLQGQ